MLYSATTALLAGSVLAAGMSPGSRRGTGLSPTHPAPRAQAGRGRSGWSGTHAAHGVSGSDGEEMAARGADSQSLSCRVPAVLPVQTAAGSGSRPRVLTSQTPPNPNPCCQGSQQQQVSPSLPVPALALIHVKALSNPSVDNQEKAAKAKKASLSAPKGLGVSMGEWELEVFGACGRTGGVGREVSLNCEGRRIR